MYGTIKTKMDAGYCLFNQNTNPRIKLIIIQYGKTLINEIVVIEVSRKGEFMLPTQSLTAESPGILADEHIAMMMNISRNRSVA
jgi:hypothetical protein